MALKNQVPGFFSPLKQLIRNGLKDTYLDHTPSIAVNVTEV